MSLHFRQRALDDLERIEAYVAARNPSAAARLAQDLIEACQRLDAFPDRGRPGRRPGTRELTTVWPYVIVYRHIRGRIEIVNIWHGRQNRG
jgi:addiction module RelE/StbE family toxin